MTDHHKKSKKELIDEIKELRHSLAVAANGPAVNRLKKEADQYLRDMITARQQNVELRDKIAEQADEVLALKAELFELRKFQHREVEHDCRQLDDEPIPYTLTGKQVEYPQ